MYTWSAVSLPLTIPASASLQDTTIPSSSRTPSFQKHALNAALRGCPQYARGPRDVSRVRRGAATRGATAVLSRVRRAAVSAAGPAGEGRAARRGGRRRHRAPRAAGDACLTCSVTAEKGALPEDVRHKVVLPANAAAFAGSPYGKYSRAVAFAYHTIGELWGGVGNSVDALRLHNMARAIRAEEAPDSLALAVRYSKVGDLYAKQNNFAAAREQYTRACRIREEKVPNSLDLAKTYRRLGYTYNNLGMCDEALVSYKKAFEICAGNGNLDLAEVYNDIGDVCKRRGNPAEAAELHYMARAIEKARGNRALAPKHVAANIGGVWRAALECAGRHENKASVVRSCKGMTVPALQYSQLVHLGSVGVVTSLAAVGAAVVRIGGVVFSVAPHMIEPVYYHIGMIVRALVAQCGGAVKPGDLGEVTALPEGLRIDAGVVAQVVINGVHFGAQPHMIKPVNCHVGMKVQATVTLLVTVSRMTNSSVDEGTVAQWWPSSPAYKY